MQQPPQDKPQDGIPYLGSRISLVSKTDIRYEGFLFNIDTRQSTVALQNVRSFGTEGRREEHVPPSPHVLQYATFKASEIKDLHVREAAPQPPAPEASNAPPQASPAPTQPPLPSATAPKPTLLTPGSVSSAQNQIQTQQRNQNQRTQIQHEAQNQQYAQNQQRAQTQQYAQNQTQQAQNQRCQAGNGANRTIPGMGGHLLKRKERRVPAGAEGAGNGPDAASGEFNFASGLSDFDKQEEFTKLEESTTQETTGSYQKSSFFDTISCDALDRLEGQRSRMSGADERKLNTETFGAVGLNNRRNFRGRGRGRRGGYRSGNWNGRDNGGGRGRNNNNNNNNGFPRPQPAGP